MPILNVGFANVWIALAGFAVCSAWVILSTGVLERWMGWWIVVAGLCLVVARFAWAAGFWGVSYALFWLWIIVVCYPGSEQERLRTATVACRC
jgi:hypothetical protein